MSELSFAQIFDIGVAVLLLTFGVRGLFRGFVGEVMSLVGVIGGAYVAWRFSSPLAEILTTTFDSLDPSIGNGIAMGLIFLCFAILMGIVARILRSIIRFAQLSSLNYLLGAVMGVARGAAVVIVVYAVINAFSNVIPSYWMQDSIAMRFASEVWPAVENIIQGVDRIE